MSEYGIYMVFNFSDYYPSGGLSDCFYSSDNVQEAISKAEESDYDYVYVFDRIEGVVIWNKV
jgi:hypothetical protein